MTQSINHLYSHKPYTTVQRRHKYTYNKYRIDINIYTVYTTNHEKLGIFFTRHQRVAPPLHDSIDFILTIMGLKITQSVI